MDGILGHYSNQHASAEVVEATALPPGMDGVQELVRVWTDPDQRKQGYATELVKAICNEADITGTVLMLQPKTFGRVGLQDLAPWYARFGFAVIQASPVLMARMPQIYKTTFSPIASAVSEAIRG